MYGGHKMKKFIILIPIYNDWQSVSKLLEEIDLQIANWNAFVSILIINDASTQQKTATETIFKNIKSVKVMNMKKNQGHARCFATALKYIVEKEDLIPRVYLLHLHPWVLHNQNFLFQ